MPITFREASRNRCSAMSVARSVLLPALVWAGVACRDPVVPQPEGPLGLFAAVGLDGRALPATVTIGVGTVLLVADTFNFNITCLTYGGCFTQWLEHPTFDPAVGGSIDFVGMIRATAAGSISVMDLAGRPIGAGTFAGDTVRLSLIDPYLYGAHDITLTRVR